MIDAAHDADTQRQAHIDKIAQKAAEQRQPIDDDFLSNRVVAAKAKTIKDLAQRNGRVPLATAIPGARAIASLPRRHSDGHTATPRLDHHNTVHSQHPEHPQPSPHPRRRPQTGTDRRLTDQRFPGSGHVITNGDWHQHHASAVGIQYPGRQHNSDNVHNDGHQEYEHNTEMDDRYSERGTPQPSSRLAVDARFPRHGGQRLSGVSVEHDKEPEPQQQVHYTFRGRDSSPPPSPHVIRNPSTGRPLGRMRLNLRLGESQLDTSSDTQPSSPTVTNSRKRSHSDSFDDDDLEDDLRSLPEPRLTASGHRAKLAIKDCAATDQEYLKAIIGGMRVRGSVRDMFPDQATMVAWVLELRDKAEEEMGGRFDITPQQCTNRLSHLRGEAKTKIAPIVGTACFESGQHPTTLKANHTHAHLLKTANAFNFKDPVNKKGMYESGLLQKAANELWFANRRDEGPTNKEFSPLPIPAVAFLLTVIENCIDEWLTGTRTAVPFTANEYRSIYQGHIMSLERFQQHTAQYGILDGIRRRLYDNGRFHSGAQPIASNVVAQIDDDDIMAAIREYEEDRGEGPSSRD
ncbi:hypothetical protein C8F01DRAFT_464944 [Mycena amicta]|nr:hypothetical protein C8F01DRAFT_464944 [Mycena amicta]